ITNSGGNDWRGRVYGFLRNKRLDARNPLAQVKDPLTQAQYGVSVGGPISRDRAFLFSNFEQTRLNNVAVLTILPGNVAAINSVLDKFKFNGPRVITGRAPTGYDSTNFLARADYRINPSNMLMTRYSY